MRKLWMLARAGIRKNKSIMATLTVMFMVAALLLNAGLLVVTGYGTFFSRLCEELNTSDAYFFIPEALSSEKTDRFFEDNEHVVKIQQNEVLKLNCEMLYQGEERGFNVLFHNLETEREISRWKYVGEVLPASGMSVYVPDIFKTVSGYQLNDTIVLNYTDDSGREQALAFTIKGYIEDIFFCSTDTGFMGFYLTGDTYAKMEGILNSPENRADLIFMNLDKVAHKNKVENGLRDLLGLNNASLWAIDSSELIVALDIELIELSRCMMASMVSLMLVVFAMIIVAVCLLVVRFRIVNSIEDDMVRIGSLKSAGYTSRQIITSVLLQFGLIAGLGSLIGIAASYPVLPAISAIFAKQSGLSWEQSFNGPISTIAFAAVLLIVAAVTLLAARKVKRLSPIHALRGESAAGKYKRNRLPLEKTAGSLPVTLAFKSMVQGLKQSMMIFIIAAAVAFAGAFGIIMFYNTSVDTKAFAEVPGMEICNAIAVLNPQMDHGDIIREINGLEDVRKTQYLDEVKLKVDDTDVSSFVMTGYAGKETRLVYDGHYPEKQGEIVLAGILAGRIDKKVGDTVTVSVGGKEELFTVTGLSNGAQMGGMNTCILTADYQRLNPDFTHQTLNIYLNKGADSAAFVKTLEGRFDKDLLRAAVDFDKGLAEGMESYQSIVAAMGLTMLAVTLFVITLVLYFVISSSVIRRKRDLGIQKAVGYTTLQLMNQIAVGFAVPMVLGVAAGCVSGAVYTNPLMSVTMRGAGIMKASFLVDPLWVALFGAATAVFAYLLSLSVTWRIRKISAYALVTE